MTKVIVTALALAGTMFVLSTAAEAACTVHGTKSNGSSFKDSVTGQDCVPTAAEKATTVKSSKSNSSEKTAEPKGNTGPADTSSLNSSRSNVYRQAAPNNPKGSATTIGSGTSGAGSGK